MGILEKILEIISPFTPLSIFVLGFGVACYVIYKLLRPNYKRIIRACDSIEKIASYSSGNLSFTEVLAKHDTQIELNARAILDMKDDIKENRTDTKLILEIVNSRNLNRN
jgi:hypothetical protein